MANLLEVKVDQITGKQIIASAGQDIVKIQAASPEKAQFIVDSWNTVVDLDQDISGSNNTESLNIFRDIACAYGAEVIQDVDGLPGLQQSRISYLTLPLATSTAGEHASADTVTWTHIERPNRGTIEWAAKQADVDVAALESYIRAPDPGYAPRASKASITRVYELPPTFVTEGFGQVTPKSSTIICGDGFLITFSQDSSGEIKRLWNDILNKRTNPQEILASGDLARALVDATAQQYQDGVEKLSEQICLFWKERGSHIPSPKILNTAQAMQQDLEVCESFAKRFDDALDTINRRDQLSERRIDQVLSPSINQTLKEIESSINRCERTIQNGKAGWGSLNEQWRNQILFKLAALSGWAVPVGVAAGIGGMNFSTPLPDSLLWGALATSAVVSAVLISKLVVGKQTFHRFIASSPIKSPEAQPDRNCRDKE